MIHEFVYPVNLTPDTTDGGFVVTFPDVPEAITQGDDSAEALTQAADALEEAIAGRIRRGDSIPEPSAAKAGQSLVPVPASTAAKAALYLALREAAISKPSLPRSLDATKKRSDVFSTRGTIRSCRGFKGLSPRSASGFLYEWLTTKRLEPIELTPNPIPALPGVALARGAEQVHGTYSGAPLLPLKQVASAPNKRKRSAPTGALISKALSL